MHCLFPKWTTFRTIIVASRIFFLDIWIAFDWVINFFMYALLKNAVRPHCFVKKGNFWKLYFWYLTWRYNTVDGLFWHPQHVLYVKCSFDMIRQYLAELLSFLLLPMPNTHSNRNPAQLYLALNPAPIHETELCGWCAAHLQLVNVWRVGRVGAVVAF